MTLLQNHCEQERTQIITILMLAMQNTRPAGYMLSGNRSTFLNTDGGVAWLCHFPKFSSPLQALDIWYHRILILFEQNTKFVGRINRQTYHVASEKLCLVDYNNVYEVDLKNDNSWCQLLHNPMLFNKLSLFKPTERGQITQFPIFDSKWAGMYTPKQSKSFWDNIIHASVSNTVLKKHTRIILTQGSKV